jgi:4-hydroxybenzoate polyprenyltransferase
MLFPLIGARLHGWLDDLVALTYLVGLYALGLQGTARLAALAGAVAHFLLTRFTNYRQGTFKLIPFRVHAFIELAEGIAVLAAAVLLSGQPSIARLFLAFMGTSQFVAFAFSDYGPRAVENDAQ